MSLTLLTADHGGIRVLTLNRPEARNALDPELVDALGVALEEAEADPGIVALVLSGAGTAFCAGADLRHLEALDRAGQSPTPFISKISALVRRLELSTLPIVASLNGTAVAGGLELALGCDAVVASEDASIGDGHVRSGLVPGGGSSVRLPRKLGPSLARWLILSGELMPARDLAGGGWLHAVVPADELAAAALDTARRLAAQAGPAQKRVKRLLADLDDEGLSSGLARELRVFDDHWHRHDVGSALRAFLGRGTAKGTTAR